MRRVSGTVPRRWVSSMRRWLIYVKRSHSQLVTASVLGQLRATLRMSIIVWRFCFSREFSYYTFTHNVVIAIVVATNHESAMFPSTIWAHSVQLSWKILMNAVKGDEELSSTITIIPHVLLDVKGGCCSTQSTPPKSAPGTLVLRLLLNVAEWVLEQGWIQDSRTGSTPMQNSENSKINYIHGSLN